VQVSKSPQTTETKRVQNRFYIDFQYSEEALQLTFCGNQESTRVLDNNHLVVNSSEGVKWVVHYWG
jgi:hypothetical protein